MVSHHLILSLLTTMLVVAVPNVHAVVDQADIDLIKTALGELKRSNSTKGEAATRRAEVRMRREAEGRIADHVAHELLPLAPPPTAPPIIQAPRLYPQ